MPLRACARCPAARRGDRGEPPTRPRAPPALTLARLVTKVHGVCPGCRDARCYQAACQGAVTEPRCRAVLFESCSSRVYPARAPDAALLHCQNACACSSNPAPEGRWLEAGLAFHLPAFIIDCPYQHLREQHVPNTRGRTGLAAAAAAAFCPNSVSPQWRGAGTKTVLPLSPLPTGTSHDAKAGAK